eukprot:123860-Amphidinium_carterae.1
MEQLAEKTSKLQSSARSVLGVRDANFVCWRRSGDNGGPSAASCQVWCHYREGHVPLKHETVSGGVAL